jgi:hypothetical protein
MDEEWARHRCRLLRVNLPSNELHFVMSSFAYFRLTFGLIILLMPGARSDVAMDWVNPCVGLGLKFWILVDWVGLKK